MPIVKPYTFVPDTDILADEVNANFDEIIDHVNGQVIHADASVPFTNVPSGPSTNPSSADQFTRKAYVDGRVKTAKLSGALSNQSGETAVLPAMPGVDSSWTIVLSVSSTVGLIVNLASISGGVVTCGVRSISGSVTANYHVHCIAIAPA